MGNPYPYGSTEATAWLGGWCQGKTEAAARPLRPSQCRDPELLARVTPEAVERWLRAHGWTRRSVSAGGAWTKGSSCGPVVYPASCGAAAANTEAELERLALGEDDWAGKILAELLAFAEPQP